MSLSQVCSTWGIGHLSKIFMEAAIVILIFGILLLACGTVGLLILRLTTPYLRGVNWLSSAFAAGSLGAGLLLLHQLTMLTVYGADLALLLSFVLLHMAVITLLKEAPGKFWHGGLLIAMQLAVDVACATRADGLRLRVISLGLLVAMQSAWTASILCRFARARVRAPAIFSSALLVLFGCFNLLRSGMQILAFGHRVLNRELSLLAFALYIAFALGMAFGFFWMTTAMLTDELEHMASTDPLTRLYNRRIFLRWCEKALLRSQRSGLLFSVLMVDLDHFKLINDNFGHQTGDEVLCAAVEKMQDSVRGIDVLCRWGGEEFAVLLPNASQKATRIIAERIRLNIQKVALSSLGSPAQSRTGFSLTASIGAATYRDFDDGIEAMLRRADAALYAAKNAGRNRVLDAG